MGICARDSSGRIWVADCANHVVCWIPSNESVELKNSFFGEEDIVDHEVEEFESMDNSTMMMVGVKKVKGKNDGLLGEGATLTFPRDVSFIEKYQTLIIVEDGSGKNAIDGDTTIRMVSILGPNSNFWVIETLTSLASDSIDCPVLQNHARKDGDNIPPKMSVIKTVNRRSMSSGCHINGVCIEVDLKMRTARSVRAMWAGWEGYKLELISATSGPQRLLWLARNQDQNAEQRLLMTYVDSSDSETCSPVAQNAHTTDLGGIPPIAEPIAYLSSYDSIIYRVPCFESPHTVDLMLVRDVGLLDLKIDGLTNLDFSLSISSPIETDYVLSNQLSLQRWFVFYNPIARWINGTRVDENMKIISKAVNEWRGSSSYITDFIDFLYGRSILDQRGKEEGTIEIGLRILNVLLLLSRSHLDLIKLKNQFIVDFVPLISPEEATKILFKFWMNPCIGFASINAIHQLQDLYEVIGPSGAPLEVPEAQKEIDILKFCLEPLVPKVKSNLTLFLSKMRKILRKYPLHINRRMKRHGGGEQKGKYNVSPLREHPTRYNCRNLFLFIKECTWNPKPCPTPPHATMPRYLSWQKSFVPSTLLSMSTDFAFGFENGTHWLIVSGIALWAQWAWFRYIVAENPNERVVTLNPHLMGPNCILAILSCMHNTIPTMLSRQDAFKILGLGRELKIVDDHCRPLPPFVELWNRCIAKCFPIKHPKTISYRNKAYRAIGLVNE